MPSICSQLTQLYQTWSDSLALMREARLRYQKSGTIDDKQAFDEALTSARTTQGEYNHEAYETLVEYRGDKIFGLKALVVQIMNARLVKGGGGTSSLTVESGSVARITFTDNNSSSIDSSLQLITYLKSLRLLYCSGTQLTTLPELPASLTELNCSGTHLTILPELPASLTWLNCSGTQLTTLPELPASLTILYCNNNTQLTALPELPDSLTYIKVSDTPAARKPEVRKQLEEFKRAHPNAEVYY